MAVNRGGSPGLGLGTMAAQFSNSASRPRSTQVEKEESDNGYDTDLEMKEEKKVYHVTGKNVYLEACKKMGLIPVQYFLRHMEEAELRMRHHGIGVMGAQALSLPLYTNTSINQLDLSDNSLEAGGARAIGDMLMENLYITELILSQNNLGLQGAKAMCEMMEVNTTLLMIDLSDNNLKDDSAPYFAAALLKHCNDLSSHGDNERIIAWDDFYNQSVKEKRPVVIENNRLRELNLSLNNLGDTAGKVIGPALSENETLEILDLSWNKLRRTSATALCDGIKSNSKLKSLRLSFNGLGNEGAMALAEVLKANNVLVELDISSNHVHMAGAMALAKGLEANETLKTLKMGQNPIGGDGALVLLKAISTERSGVTLLDITGVEVSKEFVAIEKELAETRQLQVIRGKQLGDYIIKGPKKKPQNIGSEQDENIILGIPVADFMTADPLEILCEFMMQTNSSLLDIISSTNKAKNNQMPLQEFLAVLDMADMGLSHRQLQVLGTRFSAVCNQDGLVDYNLLVKAKKGKK